MRRTDANCILYSPSDLIRFAGSAYASWMDRFALERPGVVEPDAEDETMVVLARRGDAHEDAVVAALRAEGRDVEVVPDDGSLAARVAATRVALGARREVVCQAALTDGVFAGYADFVVWDAAAGRYEIWDAKLARSARPSHLLQLCCYADMLDAMAVAGAATGAGTGAVAGAGARVETLVVVLGTGERVRFRRSDFAWYARRVRRSFLELMAAFDAAVVAGGDLLAAAAAPEPVPGADFGRWAGSAEAWFEERDHLCRVAGLGRGQAERMRAAGIETLTALAGTELARVPGIGREVFARLRDQARLQLASVGRERPVYELVAVDAGAGTGAAAGTGTGAAAVPKRTGLAMLPPASALDVYLDLEGFPLVEGGLEYLFGAVVVDSGKPVFHDWWAHDAAQEKTAFEGAVDFVMARWRADRSMHVYHYADYEVAAFRRLAGTYGTREDEIDALLRGGVFVDLYTVVRQGLRIGAPSYSLKKVEALYRGAREGAVVDAGASIVEYDRWIESGEPQDPAGSPILAAIRDYNVDDCESTWELAVWLRERQREAGIAYVPAGREVEEPERPLGEDAQERLELSRAMLAEAARMEEGEDRRVHELLAHLIEFHRREDKPTWWALFDRAERTAEELVDDSECLGDLTRVGKPKTIKRSVGVTYTFDPEQDSKVIEGTKGFLLPHLEGQTEIAELDLDAGRVVFKIGPKLWNTMDGDPPARTSFVPFDRMAATAIVDSVHAVARTWHESREMPSALADLLHRRVRVDGWRGGPLVDATKDVVAETTRVAAGLSDSCLVIQGPPGSGKTYTAARVILALLDAGMNVGVTSNSHRAIENLLAGCDDARRGLGFLKVGDEAALLEGCTGARYTASGAPARAAFAGGLVGGTAWVFAREEWQDTLDYLFVDEAGQVSLANVVGMSRSTRNLVLLGDQMQLAQPTQGTHPGESGLSALEYFLQDHATIPDDLGVFLSRTWRLHPGICGLVSDAVYEGRLLPEAHTVNRVVRVPARGGGPVPREAGIVFVPVEHEGNAQASDEEAAVIEAVVAALRGRTLTDGRGADAGALDVSDMLFVAPYNMQVRRLRERLGDTARVGSVDKFQGQEAAVVVLSMCASPGEFGPRGSAFLLDQNRLNVAISRAWSLAIVVGDPRITLTAAGSIGEMRRLNLYCRIVEAGTAGDPDDRGNGLAPAGR